MSSELGWARCTTMERFMMLKLQLQQPAAVVILSNIKTNTPKQCSTKKMASELATSSSSIAAVGETAARLAIEPRSPHGRHGERERRGQLLRPAASRRVLTCYVSLHAKIETDVALGLIEVGYEEAGRASTVPVAALACAARQAARARASAAQPLAASPTAAA